MIKLDKFNGSPILKTKIQVGFFILEVNATGTARIFDAVGKSFVKRAQAASTSPEMPLNEAFSKCQNWSKFMWDNNDRQQLIDEYQLTTEYIREFFHNTMAGVDKLCN